MKLLARYSLSLVLLVSGAALSVAQNSVPPDKPITTSAEVNRSHEKRSEAFEIVWRTVKDYHYDPGFGGIDWDAVKTEFAPRVATAHSDRELHALLQEMLNRLGKSHFNIIPPESIPIVPPEEPEASSADEKSEAGVPRPVSLNGLNITARLTHGVGIDVRIFNGSVVITRVEPLSSAARAKLKPGFVIRSVDGYSMSRVLRRMAQAAIYNPALSHTIPDEILVNYLNGPPETDVRIVYLDALNRLRRVSVKRAKLSGEMSAPFQSLPPQYVEFEARRLARGIGYLRFNVFVPLVMDKFCSALRAMSDAPGIIVDLRGNRGGVLALLFGMGGLLESRPVSLGVMRTRAGSVPFNVVPQKHPYAGQLVILIDGTSLSASEMFASGLQESGRALIIGEKSAGATLPSIAKELPTGAILQFAFADFTTPSGKIIEGEGVKPDITVKLDRRSLLGGHDPQLEAALNAIQPAVRNTPAHPQVITRIVSDTNVAARQTGRREDKEPLGQGETPVDPLVEQIIERYVQAIGGRTAIERLSSRVSRGTFEGFFTGMTVSGKVEILEKATDKSIFTITIPSFGTIRRGYNGQYGFEQISLFGFREIKGAELDNMKLASDFHWSINLRKLYPKLVLNGKEQVKNSDAYVIEATPAQGSPAKLYFDVESGLLVRKDEAYFEDYREANGVLIPFTVRGVNTLIRLSEVKHDVLIEDSKFVELKDCFTQ